MHDGRSSSRHRCPSIRRVSTFRPCLPTQDEFDSPRCFPVGSNPPGQVSASFFALGPGLALAEGSPSGREPALPEQVTRIKVTFDKPGRYVWHCHIVSHEDHEMMRVLEVGPG